MEWLICSIIIVFLIIILVIVKFGNCANIYRESISYRYTDKRKMVSVCPVKLPFSVEIQHPRETNDRISVLVEGEKKCIITYYICVSAKELQKAVEEKKCTYERKLVDVLNLISLWITEPQDVCFSGEGSYLHEFSYNVLPLDVRERLTEVLHDAASQEIYIPLLMCIQLHQQESATLAADNNVVSIASVITTSSSSGSMSSPRGALSFPPPFPGGSTSSPGGSTSSPGGSTSSPGGYTSSPGGSTSSPGGSSSGVLKYTITEQYIETLDGRVFLLKKLYKSGVDQIEEPNPSAEQPHTSTEQQSTESSELCLICQEYPVTRALLPCRHLCTCKICFSKLNLCPICRQNITSFFVVKNEGDIPEVEPVIENNDDISSLIQNEGMWSFLKSIWNAS